jgi:hypothetical protein
MRGFVVAKEDTSWRKKVLTGGETLVKSDIFPVDALIC